MPTTPTKNLLKNLELLSLGFPECFVCDHMLPKPQATAAFSSFNDDHMKTWGRENHAARIAEGAATALKPLLAQAHGAP